MAFSFGSDEGELDYDIESAIFVVNVDGSDLTRLTDDELDNRHVSWSPAGDRIAFMSTLDGSSDVYTISPDGTDRRQLTYGAWDVTNELPIWSPDGELIYYARGPSQLWRRSIWSMQADGSGKTKLWRLRGGMGTEWVLSPDGERLVITQYDPNTGYFQLFVMDSDGDSLKQISRHDSDVFDPSWSPNGEQVAYVASPGRGWAIYVRGADGGGAKRVTSGRGQRGSPEWQPDGPG